MQRDRNGFLRRLVLDSGNMASGDKERISNHIYATAENGKFKIYIISSNTYLKFMEFSVCSQNSRLLRFRYCIYSYFFFFFCIFCRFCVYYFSLLSTQFFPKIVSSNLYNTIDKVYENFLSIYIVLFNISKIYIYFKFCNNLQK